MRAIAGIRQIKEDACRVHQHVLAKGNLGHRSGKTGHPEHTVDREGASAELIAAFVQDADFFIDLGAVVRHKHRHPFSDPLFHAAVDHAAVCALHTHLVPGCETAVFKLHRHLPVQRDQGQCAVFHHAGRHICFRPGIDLLHTSRDPGRHIRVHPVPAGGSQLLIQFVQLFLDRCQRAQDRRQVQRGNQVALPQLVVRLDHHFVDLDPLRNRDLFRVDILNGARAADPGADAADGRVIRQNLIALCRHAGFHALAQNVDRVQDAARHECKNDQHGDPSAPAFSSLRLIERLKQRIVISSSFVHGVFLRYKASGW